MQTLAKAQLGRTGLSVTRLSAGGHFTNGPTAHEDIPRRIQELHHHIDSGITYFDVQWDPEEVAMAEVLKSRASEITVAWPLHGVTQRGGDVTAQYVIDYCKDHQRRYELEHVDILLWIALEMSDETQDVMVDEVRKGFEVLKQEGFCDHLGFSCHHSPEMATRAITHSDAFEVMMCRYGVLEPAARRELLGKAKAKGVGTVAMKPFGGGDGFFNRAYAGEIEAPETARWKGSCRPYRAGIKWVLQNDDLDCTVPGMHSIKEIDDLVAASSEPLNPEDLSILGTYQELGRSEGAWA